MRVAAVPKQFDQVPRELSDRVCMLALFDLGYRAMRDGDPWRIVGPKLDQELPIAADES